MDFSSKLIISCIFDAESVSIRELLQRGSAQLNFETKSYRGWGGGSFFRLECTVRSRIEPQFFNDLAEKLYCKDRRWEDIAGGRTVYTTVTQTCQENAVGG